MAELRFRNFYRRIDINRNKTAERQQSKICRRSLFLHQKAENSKKYFSVKENLEDLWGQILEAILYNLTSYA